MKIIGYSERLAFDYYDCFSPRDLEPKEDKRIKLWIHLAGFTITELMEDMPVPGGPHR